MRFIGDFMKKTGMSLGSLIPVAISILSAGAIVITAIANTNKNTVDIEKAQRDIVALEETDKRTREDMVRQSEFQTLSAEVSAIRKDVSDIHTYLLGDKRVSEKVDTNATVKVRERALAGRRDSRTTVLGQ
jgi:hypothetical protein